MLATYVNIQILNIRLSSYAAPAYGWRVSGPGRQWKWETYIIPLGKWLEVFPAFSQEEGQALTAKQIPKGVAATQGASLYYTRTNYDAFTKLSLC